MLKEFKEFAMRGNVLDMAVGIIIGAAFGTIVNSLVTDVIMPPVGLALGGVDFTNMFVTLRDGAKAAGPYASLDVLSALYADLDIGGGARAALLLHVEKVREALRKGRIQEARQELLALRMRAPSSAISSQIDATLGFLRAER